MKHVSKEMLLYRKKNTIIIYIFRITFIAYNLGI